jgi:hypothetical protein
MFFEINGCITGEDITHDKVYQKFIDFVESNDWLFLGVTCQKEYSDDSDIITAISKLKELKKEFSEKIENEYLLGFYKGIELCISKLENRMPDYKLNKD